MNPTPPSPRDAAREQMLRYLDGTLPPGEAGQLNARLKTEPGLRHDFAGLLLQQVQLAEIGQEQNAFVEMRRESVSTSPAREPEHTPALENFPQVAWIRHPAIWASGLALAACLVVGLFLWTTRDSGQALLAQAGSGVVVERIGQPPIVAAGLLLQPGDRIQTPDGAAAVVEFPGEATSTRLEPGALMRIVSLEDGKQLAVERGTIRARVAPQPAGRPLIVATAHAQATVLGTQFQVTVGAAQTRLDVWSGQVAFQPVSNGQRRGEPVEVATGHFAIASGGVALVAQPLYAGTGTILREYWLGVPGTRIADLTNAWAFPQSPTASDFRPAFESPANWNNNYGTRMRGYLQVPVTGRYTFAIEAGDEAELWFSIDGRIGHSSKIAEVGPWTLTSGSAAKKAGTSGAELELQAGRKYYIEAMHKAGTGRDHLAVYWQLPDGAMEIIPGAYLSPFVVNAQPPDPGK
jgi:ferric-dicitrate binding protein FerR (iron transport regulator)